VRWRIAERNPFGREAAAAVLSASRSGNPSSRSTHRILGA
jgi:hypothetical protein